MNDTDIYQNVSLYSVTRKSRMPISIFSRTHKSMVFIWALYPHQYYIYFDLDELNFWLTKIRMLRLFAPLVACIMQNTCVSALGVYLMY